MRGLPGDHPVGHHARHRGRARVRPRRRERGPCRARARLSTRSRSTSSTSRAGASSRTCASDRHADHARREGSDRPEHARGASLLLPRELVEGGVRHHRGTSGSRAAGATSTASSRTNEAFFEDLSRHDTTVGRADRAHRPPRLLLDDPPGERAERPAVQSARCLSARSTRWGASRRIAPGVVRTGEVDPSTPPTDATTMASQVGTVFSATLPLGPTWLLPDTTKPNVAYDGAWCGQCHQAQYAAWQKSAHAHAAVDPMVRFCAARRGEEQRRPVPAPVRRLPRSGDARSSATRRSRRGAASRASGAMTPSALIQAGGNADLQVERLRLDGEPQGARRSRARDARDPLFCGGCHQQFVPGIGHGGDRTRSTSGQGAPTPGGTSAGPFATRTLAPHVER